ncbi:MAG: hypothetical protein NVV74_20190 [Magnetospirillum sp.]|nr:hypothetical protein [Magnetospirillum sp.]
MSASEHLWLALSPHGYGHAAMTAPLVAELRRRRPHLRLTIQTALPKDFLATRYGDFDYVGEIPDIGFRMKSALKVDVPASARFYIDQHADFAAVVGREAERLGAAKPDLVLANVPYVTVAAAAAAGLPVVAFCSLNWADLGDYYLGHLPECGRALADIRAAYTKASVFLRPTPAQPMTLPNVADIGLVARLGTDRREEIRTRLGLEEGERLGLIAFGGIDHRLPLERWPKLPGWRWLTSLLDIPSRPDMVPWERAGVPFADLVPSVDVMVTKSGYGTFSECGLAGVPVLYEARPDWPEGPPLERWLGKHTRCLATTPERLVGGGLPDQLRTLFFLPNRPVARPTGVAEGVQVLESMLDGAPMPAFAVGHRGNHDAEASNGGCG